MDRRLWVDFRDEHASGKLPRLRITTKNQPFGFQRNEPSRKLLLDDRRKAHDAFEAVSGKIEPNLTNAWPFSHDPGLPIDLGWLIDTWRQKSDSSWRQKSDSREWLSAVNDRLQRLQGAKFIRKAEEEKWSKKTVWQTLGEDEKANVLERVEVLADALARLGRLKMPLISVDKRFFEIEGAENNDPPLAVLYKRIGTGGTPLSDADYVYAVIKHLQPETYDLVETLHQPGNVGSLLTATDLVMSAVRLAAVTWKHEDSRPVADMENPNKREFHRLLQRGDFIREQFLPLIQKTEQGEIARYFSEIEAILRYRGGCDTGLPKQAFPLLRRPLVQVLLRLAQVGYLDNREDMARRKDVLRLVLFWLVAVTDASKASRLAYKVINENVHTEKCDPNVVLGRPIHDRLVTEEAVVPLPAPDEIKKMPGLVFSPENTTWLRCESRFDFKQQDFKEYQEEYSKIYIFYRNNWWRPWTHQHPILLWLQREMVAEKLDIKADPMAGRDEDTPYDYDHILPYNHWGQWTGVTRGDTLLKRAEDKKIWVVGNAIGNIRVWPSINNRADGNRSPSCKLKLYFDDDERRMCLTDSAIDRNQIEDWKEASNDPPNVGQEPLPAANEGRYRSWSFNRALAFQRAVEKRTFDLYQRYFNDLGFAEWCDSTGV